MNVTVLDNKHTMLLLSLRACKYRFILLHLSDTNDKLLVPLLNFNKFCK